MIKHIVMWDVRGETVQARKEAALVVKNKFDALAGVIPGMRCLEIGLDVSGVDYACHVVLYSEFDSQEALDAYASHPAHQKIRRELGDIRISRHQVDYISKAV